MLLIVEDNLLDGLKQELATYSNDVKKEYGFQTIIKIFDSSDSVFEIKSYITQIYNNQRLNGVLLIGDIPSGKFYHPAGYYPKDDLPLYDYIYQDIYDACKYSDEWDAFDYSNPACENTQIPPFWISRLTPNSYSQSKLSLLQDYFKRNHEYRTGQYSYAQKILLYEPVVWEEADPYRTNTILSIKNNLKAFNMYDENGIIFIDAGNENSDQLYLNEVKNPYGYELLFVNAHGSPTFHGKNIIPNDISNVNFFLGEFISCSVGRFTTEDYIAGNYLFNGKGLALFAAPVIIFGGGIPDQEFHYLLSIGEPLYEAMKIKPLGGANAFGDLTLKMRDVKKPNIYSPDDAKIVSSATSLDFENNQDAELKIKNIGKSTLEFKLYPRYYKFKERWLPTYGYSSEDYIEMNEHGHYLLAPGVEVTFKIKHPSSEGAPSGSYKGEIFILSNDPIKPYISIPFEAVVK